MKGFEPDKSLSVVKGFFCGEIVEKNLFPYPAFDQTEAETLSMVIDSVDKFMQDKEEQYREFDREGEQPEDYIESLKSLGLFSLIIPEEFGGLGLSNAGYSRVLQQTTHYDGSTSLTIGAHSSIGMKGLLLFGTKEQKEKYLPRLASGEMIAAFCLTEPSSGSDAASIKTSASKNPDGTWTLQGEKIWITNGAFADFFTVFARTGTEKGKLTAFIVERCFSGVGNGPKEDKMGIRASATTSVRFDNVVVPAENILGEEGMGFKVAMSILNNGRTGLGGGCVGAMKRCISLATQQATERKQFGRSISEFELIREKIATMTVQCYATESVVHMVANYIDSPLQDYSVEAAISKIFASESLWLVAFEALQIAAGNGFMRDYPYERIVRDSRINLIFEGTNEILRLYVALSGMKDVGENLKEMGKSAGKIFNDPIKGFGVLSGYATKKLQQMTPLTRKRLGQVAQELEKEATVIEIYTQRLAKATDAVLRRYQKDIIGQQLLSKRLADIATDLFVSACVLSRVTESVRKKGKDGASAEIQIARLFIQQAKRRMNQNMRRLENNEDDTINSLARYVLTHGGFEWDVLR